jgi:hypothetical protein
LIITLKLLLGENRLGIIIRRLEKFCGGFLKIENRRISTEIQLKNRFDMDVGIDLTQ